MSSSTHGQPVCAPIIFRSGKSQAIAIEVHRTPALAGHGLEHVPDLHGHGDIQLDAFREERIHLRVVERDVESVDVHVHAFEAVLATAISISLRLSLIRNGL